MNGQLKSHFTKGIFAGNTLDAFAVAAPGLSALLARELDQLGITHSGTEAGGVQFRATAEEVFAVNLHSRIASRVIIRLATFPAHDFAILERKAGKVPWQLVTAHNRKVRLRVTCRKSRLYHSDAVAERIGRAITAATGAEVLAHSTDDKEDESSEAIQAATQPLVHQPVHEHVQQSAQEPAQLILVRMEHDVCTISADSSGELLHRRGWRQAVAKAPLRETLAAAMLMACEWTGETPLVDPFCGSGTIGIEAALMARRMAAGKGRNVAIEKWPGAPRAHFQKIREAATAMERHQLQVPIVISDRDSGACDAALANAERAGVADNIQIVHQSLSDVALHRFGASGLVLANPPYGLRISDNSSLRRLYSRLGDVVRDGGPGWRLAFLAPEQRSGIPLGMSVRTLFRTSNGGIAVSMQMATQKTSAAQLRQQ